MKFRPQFTIKHLTKKLIVDNLQNYALFNKHQMVKLKFNFLGNCNEFHLENSLEILVNLLIR